MSAHTPYGLKIIFMEGELESIVAKLQILKQKIQIRIPFGCQNVPNCFATRTLSSVYQ